MTKTVYIAAVENSADHLGADLIRHLRDKAPEIDVRGIGGPVMAAEGVETEIDISGLAVLGFVEGLKAYPLVLDRVRAAVDSIMDIQPDAAVLIDGWGFMVRIARSLKKAGYKGQIIKYLAPQVWAMREGRSKILAEAVDHLMSIHSFDAPYFERHGLPVTYVGNPVFDTDYRSGDGQALRMEFGIHPKDEVISVFFGSRLSEIQTLARPFADTVEQLKARRPRLKFISPVSESIATDVNAAAGEDLRLQDIILLPESRKFDVFAASDVALACSGTVTTQLACAGVPTVVAYKVNALTYFVGKRLLKTEHISIVNIAAGERLMPEFLQVGVNGETLSREIETYLNDSDIREATSRRLIAQTDKMKGEGSLAGERAADTVLNLINA